MIDNLSLSCSNFSSIVRPTLLVHSFQTFLSNFCNSSDFDLYSWIHNSNASHVLRSAFSFCCFSLSSSQSVSCTPWRSLPSFIFFLKRFYLKLDFKLASINVTYLLRISMSSSNSSCLWRSRVVSLSTNRLELLSAVGLSCWYFSY